MLRLLIAWFSAFFLLYLPTPTLAAPQKIEADLLIVGGTESGCAAAIQAARMGVQSIVLVNDIEWLGGQFSAESLVAIDENTNVVGKRHEQPVPRSGMFLEVVERIEAVNLKKFGRARPGNTRTITTCRPADAADSHDHGALGLHRLSLHPYGAARRGELGQTQARR